MATCWTLCWTLCEKRGRSLACVRAICVDGACAVSVVERGLSTMHLGCGCLAPAAADVAYASGCSEHVLIDVLVLSARAVAVFSCERSHEMR